jgi:hypothetical protein
VPQVVVPVWLNSLLTLSMCNTMQDLVHRVVVDRTEQIATVGQAFRVKVMLEL